MNEVETKNRWSLATIVTFYCALTLAVAMALYAVAEIIVFRESFLLSLFRHTAHVIVLSFLILAVMAGVIYRKVTAPIAQINGYLYRLGAGDTLLPPPHADSVEFDALLGGIRSMMDRMHSGRSGVARVQAEQALEELRHLAKSLHEAKPEESSKLLDVAARLGECVASIQGITRK